MKNILLSFDLEEFDIPLEYGNEIAMDEQMKIGLQGLQNILPILDKYNIKVTFFTTANFALHFPEVVKQLSLKHEIASHAFTHTGFKPQDLLESKLVLEKIINKNIIGFRMPRLAAFDTTLLKQAGYLYDSSIHPTWIPGRYNNRHLPTQIYIENNLLRIPCSVSTNLFRFPMFWLSFKNFPLFFYQFWLQRILKKNNFACLYFHPWEFANINNYKMPKYIKNPCGLKLVNKLEEFIQQNIKKGHQFITIQEYLYQNNFL